MGPEFILLVIIAGLALLLLSKLGRRKSGVPDGEVVYSDTGAEREQEKPLYSARYRLAGRPDYLVNKDNRIIPVEVKSGRAPEQPYQSHILQLAAYCLLVEEVYRQRPPYGIIRYADCMFEVDYTDKLKRDLIEVLGQIRADMRAPEVRRSHNQEARCMRCGYRHECDDSLALPGVRPDF
ncbi:MAG: CRISPR-associated protein Cas4 [Anaerolineae bacterium]|nr:CRISPR-associated protein Cas4 [Anaerolineae bacterium]